MEMTFGYKKTEVGDIPEDWTLVALSGLLRFRNGANADKDAYGSGTPFINVLEVITNSHLLRQNIPGSVALPKAVVDSFAVRRGDVFFNRTSETQKEIGLASVYIDDELVVFGGFVIRGRPINSHLTLQYTGYGLRAPAVRAQIVARGQGAIRANIGQSDLSNVWVPVPPIAEQHAIAEALRDADSLIESLEKLLAKKNQLKQGVMQELLTGKKRLPGFIGEWQKRQIGEMIDHCSSGATPYRGRPDFYKGKVKWITSGELNYDVITDTIEHISDEAVKKANLKVHPVGTFLMAITGLEAAGTRGACGIVGSPATTNQSCMAIYPSPDLKSAYLYHYYVFRGNDLALQYCQGTKQQSYTAKLIRLLPIDIPPTVDEQAAIAAVLTDMDAEIATLKVKLVKAEDLKKGMMQQLLTGRIRLV